MDAQWQMGVAFGVMLGLIEIVKALIVKLNNNGWRKDIDKLLYYANKQDRDMELRWMSAQRWHDDTAREVKELTKTVKDAMIMITGSTDSGARRLFPDD